MADGGARLIGTRQDWLSGPRGVVTAVAMSAAITFVGVVVAWAFCLVMGSVE